MKITILRLIEKLFGKLLCRIFIILNWFGAKSGPFALTIGEVNKILVVRTGGFGDGILAIPFLRKSRNAFRNAEITLICIKRNKVVFTGLPYIDKLVIIDEHQDIFSNMKNVFGFKWDVIFDLEPVYRISAVLCHLIKSKMKIGFDTNERRSLYTHFVCYDQSEYEADSFLKQLKIFYIEISSEDRRLVYPLTRGNLEKAQVILRQNSIDNVKDFLIAVSLGTLNPQNRWSTANFSELLRKILEHRNDIKIILIGGKNDVFDTNKLVTTLSVCEFGNRVISIVGKTNFYDTLAVLTNCRLFIGHDAGPLHMAASVGVSTLSFFGSAIESRWKPKGSKHIGMNKHYICGPCRRGRFSEMPKCPYGFKCIRDITVEETFETAKRLIETARRHDSQ